MADSSSHKPSSPEITPKEETVTLDKPKSPNTFLPADQVEFIFEEIAFTTNNEVALLYPSHPNSNYFREVSDFISKCCLKEAFIRAPTQYKEYLSEFWYTAKTLDDSKIWVSTPTGGIRKDIGYSGEIGTKGILKKSCLPLRRKQSSKHTSESKTKASKSKTSQSEKETQSSSTKDKIPSHPLPPTLVVDEIHEEAQQAAGGPTSLGATSKDEAHLQLSSGHDASADSTAKDDPGLSAPTNYIPSQQDQTKSAGDGLKTAKTNSDELEQQKATAEAEVTSLKAKPSYPDINQLTGLLVTSLEPELSKLLALHNFASCLPTELKELPSKFTELFKEIKELKQHVAELRSIQWELPSEFLDLPSHVSSVQEKLKALDSLPSLLNKVTKTLNRFATVVETVLGATTAYVPSACQATASLAEEEKSTKDADTNLKDELVDRLGTNVVTQYYNKKLLFDKYCDKMLKRKKSPKITNCEVLTKKGPITLKIYREDGSEEVISNLMVSDLHLVEWRKVIQACQDKSEKGWKTIYDLVKTRLDQLTQTEQELKIDLNKPLKEHDPLNELNELANKKRKRTSDLKDHSRSTKKHKSSSSA
ncbi:hypothetical protein Tco_1326244 [Tanacetum coccineum]